MAVSEGFLDVFSQLVEKYSKSGRGSYLLSTWFKDSHYETINQSLTDLRDIIQHNKEPFNDKSLIQYLSSSAVTHLKEDPIFANCVNELIVAYKKIPQSACLPTIASALQIDVHEDDDTAPTLLMDELQQLVELTKKQHKSELKLLKRQLIMLQDRTKLLQTQNQKLTAEVETLHELKHVMGKLVNITQLVNALSEEVKSVPTILGNDKPSASCSSSVSMPKASADFFEDRDLLESTTAVTPKKPKSTIDGSGETEQNTESSQSVGEEVPAAPRSSGVVAPPPPPKPPLALATNASEPVKRHCSGEEFLSMLAAQQTLFQKRRKDRTIEELIQEKKSPQGSK